VEEALVTGCIAVNRAEIVGKFNTGTERVKTEETVEARAYARYVTEIARHNNSQQN
jgi:hypothetical protein